MCGLRIRKAFLLLPLIFGVGLEMKAQDASSHSGTRHEQVNTVSWSRDLMLALYPELNKAPVHLLVSDNLSLGEDYSFHVFTVTVEPFQRNSVDLASIGIELPLHAKFNFRKDDLLSSWEGDDFPKKVLDARKLVDEHQEWTETDIDKCLSNSGALFPPEDKQRLINALPLKAFDKLFGHIRLKKLEFWYRDKDTPPSAILTWHLEFEVLHDGSPHHSYVMAVDPFSGRPILIELDRSPIAYQSH